MVSLVMPVWRPKPEWLREAVESALAETACPIELIVVDDGNPEPVSELLEDVDDPRLRVVRVPHSGVSRARNAGIAHAGGTEIRFIDADDLIEPASTSRLLQLSGPERAIAYGSTLVCGPDLHPERLVEEDAQGDVLLECVLGGFSVFITAMLFPREVIEAAGGFDPEFDVNEDYEYLLRALEQAPVRGGPFVATRYRRHGDSATAGEHAGRMMDMLALEKFFERHPELHGTRTERAARAHLHVVAAEQLVFVGRYARAFAQLARGVFGSPSALPQALWTLARIPRLALRRLLQSLR